MTAVLFLGLRGDIVVEYLYYEITIIFPHARKDILSLDEVFYMILESSS
jgi:hypothetical protein